MEERFKITTINQLLAVRDFVTTAIFLTLGYELAKFFLPDHDLDFSLATIILIWFLLFQFFPYLIIHIQYYAFNKNTKVSINKISRTMTISQGGDTVIFPFEQIKYVRVDRIHRWSDGNMRPWGIVSDRYRYALMKIEDGQRFVITSFIIYDLVKFYHEIGVNVTEHPTAFPLIFTGQTREETKQKRSDKDWVV